MWPNKFLRKHRPNQRNPAVAIQLRRINQVRQLPWKWPVKKRKMFLSFSRSTNVSSLYQFLRKMRSQRKVTCFCLLKSSWKRILKLIKLVSSIEFSKWFRTSRKKLKNRPVKINRTKTSVKSASLHQWLLRLLFASATQLLPIATSAFWSGFQSPKQVVPNADKIWTKMIFYSMASDV